MSSHTKSKGGRNGPLTLNAEQLSERNAGYHGNGRDEIPVDGRRKLRSVQEFVNQSAVLTRQLCA
jgi:hypothetical protein